MGPVYYIAFDGFFCYAGNRSLSNICWSGINLGLKLCHKVFFCRISLIRLLFKSQASILAYFKSKVTFKSLNDFAKLLDRLFLVFVFVFYLFESLNLLLQIFEVFVIIFNFWSLFIDISNLFIIFLWVFFLYLL